MRRLGRRVSLLTILVAGVLAVGVAVVLATAVEWGTGSGSPTGQTAAARQPDDLVWISDSSGWGVASVYARHISQDRKVTVRVQDGWEAGLAAFELREWLHTPGWVSKIRQAEAIVVYASPASLEIVKGGDCIFSNKPPLYVGPKAWPKYIAAMKAIYKRIFEIRKGAPVIMRTYTMYAPTIAHAPPGGYAVKSWKDAGIAGICTKKWESYAWVIRQAAAAYQVPVADVYTAFNGKNHREDPVAKGYLQPDGVHPNDKGRALIAKTLAALGYKPVTPPR